VTAPRCFQASTSSRRGHSHSKPSSHCIMACGMTRPTTIFSTLLTPSKTSPSATGVSSVAAATAERRAEGHPKEKGQGEGVRVEGDADSPGPQSSQHRASHFSLITLFPRLPPPCPRDPCACACHRWWPNVLFCSSGSSCSQSTIPISSSTSAESSLSALSNVTISHSEMSSRCFGTSRHFPAFDNRPSSFLGD
jgi:hypothetical protein